MNPYAMYEVQLYAGLPLFAFLVVLSAGVCILIFLAIYNVCNKGRYQPSRPLSIRDALAKFTWPLCILVTSVLFLIINHLLVRGLAVGIWDVDGQYYPYQVLVADYARAGRFLLWDPWSNAGRPILGDPQVGAFSPLNVAVGFLTGGSSSGFIIYWLLMWWLGGLGILLLARHLQAPPWGGCVVALGFLFCGAYTGHAEHTSTITSFSFLPFILWRLDSAICSRRLRPAIEAGALWGLSALGGYPSLTIFTGCYSGLWTLGRSLYPTSLAPEHGASDSKLEAAKSHSLNIHFVAAVLLAVLLTGVVVLSPTYAAFFVEGAGTNTRVNGLNRERAVFNNALHPGALATFASPYLPILKLRDQMNGENSLWSYTDVSSSSIYSGVLITVFALLALVRDPRAGWRWWLLGLGALSLACALGQTLPIRGWLYDWFYPMRFFRSAAKLRLYFMFSLSVLALLATRDIAIAAQSDVDRPWKHLFTVSSFVAACALVVFAVFATYIRNTTAIVLILGWTHALYVWLGISLLAFIAYSKVTRIRRSYIPALLLALGATDAFFTAVLSTPTMINTKPEYVKRWRDLDEIHTAGLELTKKAWLREDTSCYPKPPCESLKNDQLITKIPVFNSYATGESLFHNRMTEHPVLKAMAIGSDRVWFSKHVSQVALTEGNFAAFEKRATKLGAPPLVVHTATELTDSAAALREHFVRRQNGDESSNSPGNQTPTIIRLPAAQKLAVDLIRYLPDELIFNVQSPEDGWLLVTDRWGYSWRATVNGKDMPLYVGNFIFRAVQVSAGRNNIRFTYHPFGFPGLLIMSWGTLAVVATCSVYGGLRSWRSS
jgi:hypothetical protein